MTERERWPERPARFETLSGIPIEALYTPASLREWSHDEQLGRPGEYPFTRRVYPPPPEPAPGHRRIDAAGERIPARAARLLAGRPFAQARRRTHPPAPAAPPPPPPPPPP